MTNQELSRSHEYELHDDDFLISRTDLKGKITYANWTGASLFRSADQLDFEPESPPRKRIAAP